MNTVNPNDYASLAEWCELHMDWRLPDGISPNPWDMVKELAKDNAIEQGTPSDLDPDEVISICEQIDCQSCEYPGWSSSRARVWLDYVEGRALQYINSNR
jgi:hypothetical protein